MKNRACPGNRRTDPKCDGIGRNPRTLWTRQPARGASRNKASENQVERKMRVDTPGRQQTEQSSTTKVGASAEETVGWSWNTASRWSRSLPGMIRNPIHLDWKFRGNLEEPERVGSSISATGDLRGRVRFGDERSTTGSSTVPRKRVTRLGQVQTVVAPSAGRTKAQGRMTGCSGTATWSNATGSITDEYPEVERVGGAAPSGK